MATFWEIVCPLGPPFVPVISDTFVALVITYLVLWRCVYVFIIVPVPGYCLISYKVDNQQLTPTYLVTDDLPLLWPPGKRFRREVSGVEKSINSPAPSSSVLVSYSLKV